MSLCLPRGCPGPGRARDNGMGGVGGGHLDASQKWMRESASLKFAASVLPMCHGRSSSAVCCEPHNTCRRDIPDKNQIPRIPHEGSCQGREPSLNSESGNHPASKGFCLLAFSKSSCKSAFRNKRDYPFSCFEIVFLNLRFNIQSTAVNPQSSS